MNTAEAMNKVIQKYIQPGFIMGYFNRKKKQNAKD